MKRANPHGFIEGAFGTVDGSYTLRHSYGNRGAAYYATSARLWLLVRLCYALEQIQFHYLPTGAVNVRIDVGPCKGMSQGTLDFLSASLWPWPDNPCGEGGDCDDGALGQALSGADREGNSVSTWELIVNAVERDAEDRNGLWHSIAPHVADALTCMRSVLVLPLPPPCYAAHLHRHAWTVEGSL
jgi:hypothetical protein